MRAAVKRSLWDNLHFILIVHFYKLLLDQVVVGAVCVVQIANVVEDRLHLGNVACCTNPKLLFRVAEVPCLNVLYLIYRVVTLFPPLQLLIQEIHHRKVVRPDVVPPRKVHIVVRVQRGE